MSVCPVGHGDEEEEEKIIDFFPQRFEKTRPKPAYGRQGLDWIVGPGYSFVVFSTDGQSDHFS